MYLSAAELQFSRPRHANNEHSLSNFRDDIKSPENISILNQFKIVRLPPSPSLS